VKLFVACLIALALGGAYADPGPSAAGPGQRPRISITATLERITTTGVGQARFYLLWNRKKSSRPIGHAVYACRRVSGSSLCSTLFAMPLGKISAIGEIRRFSRYTLVVVGGTRCYAEGEPGVVGAWPLAPGASSLVFSLTTTC
jgi:hypothetical protein